MSNYIRIGQVLYDPKTGLPVGTIGLKGEELITAVATQPISNGVTGQNLANIAKSNAMVWLEFDEASGSTTVVDKVSAVSGTLQGATPTTAWQHPQGWTPNGTDQYIPLTTGQQAGFTGAVRSIGNLSTLAANGDMLLFVALLEHPSSGFTNTCLLSYGLQIDDTGSANFLGGWGIYLTTNNGRLQFQMRSPGATSAGGLVTATPVYDGAVGKTNTNTRTAVALEIRASSVVGWAEMIAYQITINDVGNVLQQNIGAITFKLVSGGILTTTGYVINNAGVYSQVPTLSVPAPATPQGAQAKLRCRLNGTGIDAIFFDEPGSGYTAAQMPLPVTITKAAGDASAGGGVITLSSTIIGGAATGPVGPTATAPLTVGAWFGHNVSSPIDFLGGGVTIQKIGVGRVPNAYGLGYQCCMDLRDDPTRKPKSLGY